MTHQVQSVPLKTSLLSAAARATLALLAGGRWLATKLALAGAAGGVALGLASPAGAAATTGDDKVDRGPEAIGFTERLGAVRQSMASRGVTPAELKAIDGTRHASWWDFNKFQNYTAVAGVRG